MKKLLFLMAVSFTGLTQAAAGDWTGYKTITTLLIENNRAVFVLDNEVNLHIEDSFFFNNISDEFGGGLFHQDRGNNQVINSTFAHNSARRNGGAIVASQVINFTVINSTISNNSAVIGAGMIGNSGDISVINSTVIENQGSGLLISNPMIQNSIIANNADVDCDLTNVSEDNNNNLDSDGTCDVNATNHLTVNDPMLEPLLFFGGNTPTHRPLPDSPVIDAGNDVTCAASDQRGIERPQDGDDDLDAICDIGAVEFTLSEEVPREIIFKFGFDE